MQVLISSHMLAEQHELMQQCQRQVHAQQRERLNRRPVSGCSPGLATQWASDRWKKLEDDFLQIHDVLRRFAERTEGVFARFVSESAEQLNTPCLKTHSNTDVASSATRVETNLQGLMKAIAQQSVESIIQPALLEHCRRDCGCARSARAGKDCRGGQDDSSQERVSKASGNRLWTLQRHESWRKCRR